MTSVAKITIDNPAIDPDDLPEYVVDQLEGFCKEKQLILDKDGFVTGNVTPSDVLSLGYQLLAWTLVSKLYNNNLIGEEH